MVGRLSPDRQKTQSQDEFRQSLTGGSEMPELKSVGTNFDR